METLGESRPVLLAKYLFDVRVISMTGVTVSLAAAYAAYSGATVFPLLFALTLIAALLLHMGANALNHFLDSAYGVDRPDNALSQGPPRIIPLGVISRKKAGLAGLSLMLASFAVGLYLSLEGGAAILAIGAAGVALFAAYDVKPLQLKTRAMGELVVFLIWGPLMALGSFDAATKGKLSPGVVPAVIPETLMVVAMLYVNNLEHEAVDRAEGATTLPMLLGKNDKRAFYIMLALPFLAQVLVALARLAPASTYATLLSAPYAAAVARTENRGDRAYFKTAKLLTIYGLLYLLGFLAALRLRALTACLEGRPASIAAEIGQKSDPQPRRGPVSAAARTRLACPSESPRLVRQFLSRARPARSPPAVRPVLYALRNSAQAKTP